MILELPDVPIRKILLNLSLADFNSVQSVFISTNNIYLKQLGFQIYISSSTGSSRTRTVTKRERRTGLRGDMRTILLSVEAFKRYLQHGKAKTY